MISMVGSLIWIGLWIFYGVEFVNQDQTELAIRVFFVPVGCAFFLIGEANQQPQLFCLSGFLFNKQFKIDRVSVFSFLLNHMERKNI